MKDTDSPRAFAEVNGQNANYLGPGADKAEDLTAASSEDARAIVLRRTVWEARRLGRPIELTTAGDQGNHRITVAPDGTVTPSMVGDDIDQFTSALPVDGDELAVTGALRGIPRNAPTPQLATNKQTGPRSLTATRPSFIESDLPPGTARTGLAGVLARIGVPVKPTAAQTQHLENVRATSRHWGGCRTIAVVNGKGGVGKTMTSAMLAAVFARNGGGGVLAWDNNDTRGTLGWRTEAGHHDATIQHALAAAPQLLAGSAAAADIAWYVHHQTQDRYDVLRSNPQLLAVSQRIGQTQFDQLMQVAARYYRLVIFDSGNDESAERWMRMIDAADQLVVPTLASPESAESAALLLEALTDRDERSATLARSAVVVVTQAERGSAAEVHRVADAFAGLVREVHEIPFDPSLKGGPLRFDQLRPATQRAWVATAASIAAEL